MILINSSPKDALKIFQPFLPITAPVGIGCLIAFAKREGIKARFIDEQVEGDTLGLVSEYVKDMRPPYIFGFSVLTAAFKRAVETSEKLKRLYPDSVVVFGGIHPTALPEEALSYKHIDLVVRGEGERALVALYRSIKEGRDFSQIDNLSFRRDGAIVHNRISDDLVALDDLPDFPYDIFDRNRYNMAFVVSSRGCPFRCIFCSNQVSTGKRYRNGSAQRIIRDLHWICSHYIAADGGRLSVGFQDDNLLVNKKRIYELLAEIKKNGFDKTMAFACQARGDNVDRELLQDLFDAGFRDIFFGLETASERIMELIKKDESVSRCAQAVRMAKDAGFHVSATFIYGFPQETHQDRMACLRLAKELKLDMVRFNNATPYPGTELYDIARREGRLRVKGLYENFNSVSAFIESPFNEIPFSYVPAGSTEAEIRDDLLYSYFSFYLNPDRFNAVFSGGGRKTGWFNPGRNIVSLIRKAPALFLLGLNILLKLIKLLISISARKLFKAKGG